MSDLLIFSLKMLAELKAPISSKMPTTSLPENTSVETMYLHILVALPQHFFFSIVVRAVNHSGIYVKITPELVLFGDIWSYFYVRTATSNRFLSSITDTITRSPSKISFVPANPFHLPYTHHTLSPPLYLQVTRAFSFHKTPMKMKRSATTSPIFGSTNSLTPATQLAQMKLASCTNINVCNEDQSLFCS